MTLTPAVRPDTLRPDTLRLGTRGSALALAQSGQVADALRAHGHRVELVRLTTRGDTSTEAIPELGSTGVFVSALRDALLAGEVDLAVHSYKDLPTAPADGLVIAAVPTRADPRDALVARDGLTLGELPAGSRVGTGSPRRTAQLRALGMGLQVEPIRGNVDTRIGLVTSGAIDAVVVAQAGLARLGRLEVVTESLDPLQVLPAPAQGALAVECAAGRLVETLGVLDDPLSRACVEAERELLAVLEAGCSAPVGALAEVSEGDDGEWELYLRGLVAALDGSDVVRQSATGALGDARKIGDRLAHELLDLGARDLL